MSPPLRTAASNRIGGGNATSSVNGQRSGHDSIAIIGMSGRFPGAPTIDRFWDNLRHGVESITPFSRSRLKAAGVDDSAFENPHYVPMGSVLEDVDLFDAAFFGFSPREAESLDPQQRLFLETAWHALEDAGYDPATFPGLIGVYGGCAMSSYLDLLESNPEFMALLGYLQIYIGNDKDYLTTRVSYELDLKGPSFSVQTACSTSLLAVAVAGDQLLSHQCDMALAGGVCVARSAGGGLLLRAGRDLLARRPLPGVRRASGGCRVRQRRRSGGPASAVGRHCRRRPDLCRGQGMGGQQRRRCQGQLCRAEPGRPSRCHRSRPRARGSQSRDDHLRRGSRNRYAGRRSDRDRRADQGIPTVDRQEGLLCRRLGEDKRRAPGSGGRRGEPDQDRSRSRAWRDPAQLELHDDQPRHRASRAARSTSTPS